MRTFPGLSLAVVLLTAVQANAHEAGEIIARAGIANVSPDASSSALVLDGVAIAGSEADVDDNVQLGLSFTYMLTDHWALDLLASTPFSHDISADTGALGLGKVDAGKTKHLPPTLSVMFYPADSASRFQPYVGAGFNYTLFFSEDVDSQLEGVLGRGDLKLDDSFGLALQVGFDYELTEQMYLNAGLRWIDIDTDAEFEFANNTITTDVEIDPLVYMVSLGWKF